MQLNIAQFEHKKLMVGSVLFAAAAFAASLAVGGGSTKAAVGGPNCNVPGDYATIQLAVNDPGCTTVKVAPGAYSENVVVNRSVNIKGAKAGVPVATRTFGSPGESKVTGAVPGSAVFTVNAADVKINGFSVTNPNEGLGIIVKTTGNNADIKKNIVDGVGNNTFAAPTVGIYLELGPDGVRLSGNRINNVQSGTGSAQGVLVGDSTSSNPSLDIKIDGNHITNLTSASKGAYGIQANNGASTAAAATGYSEVNIRGNTIKTLTGNWVHAIGLEGETPNAVVKYNTISNLTDSNPAPIADAVGINFESNPFFFTASVNRNSLDVSNTNFGIAVNPALTNVYSSLSVDGECNWWGSSNGPGAGIGSVGTGTGSKVTTGVDYKPWLKSANLDKWCGDKDHNDHDHHYGDYKEHKNDDRRGDWNRHDD